MKENTYIIETGGRAIFVGGYTELIPGLMGISLKSWPGMMHFVIFVYWPVTATTKPVLVITDWLIVRSFSPVNKQV